MKAHEADLRAEVEKELLEDGIAALPAAQQAADLATDLAAQGSEAALHPRLRALLQFAERLTLAPGDFREEHLAPLRDVGLDDRALHDAAQVVSYFCYINRIADGLGVDLEPEMGSPPD